MANRLDTDTNTAELKPSEQTAPWAVLLPSPYQGQDVLNTFKAFLGPGIQVLVLYNLVDAIDLHVKRIVVADGLTSGALSGWQKALEAGIRLFNFSAAVGLLKPLDLEDLLEPDATVNWTQEDHQAYKGKRILITGAAGSIGSELARQLLALKPQELFLLDTAESPLVDLCRELQATAKGIRITPLLQDICHSKRMSRVFKQYKPQVVVHAAAYKHVPLLQDAIWPAMQVNYWGTMVVAQLAMRNRAERFILLSTDKAVSPACLMGATKWMAEQYVLNLSQQARLAHRPTKFMTVRFGNVLGSRGSVLPLWRSQLAAGQAITLTDPEMERFFISTTTATQRMLKAGALGHNGGLYGFWMPTYLMGTLARYMNLLHGVQTEPHLVGSRPGERMKECLIDQAETIDDDLCEEVFSISRPLPDPESVDELSTNILEALRYQLEGRLWRLVKSACPQVEGMMVG